MDFIDDLDVSIIANILVNMGIEVGAVVGGGKIAKRGRSTICAS